MVPANVRRVKVDVLFAAAAAIGAARRRVTVLSAILSVEVGRHRDASREAVFLGEIMIDLDGPGVLIVRYRIVVLEILIDPGVEVACDIRRRRDALENLGVLADAARGNYISGKRLPRPVRPGGGRRI